MNVDVNMGQVLILSVGGVISILLAWNIRNSGRLEVNQATRMANTEKALTDLSDKVGNLKSIQDVEAVKVQRIDKLIEEVKAVAATLADLMLRLESDFVRKPAFDKLVDDVNKLGKHVEAIRREQALVRQAHKMNHPSNPIENIDITI